LTVGAPVPTSLLRIAGRTGVDAYIERTYIEKARLSRALG
jgi:hypothetical protein